MASIDIAEGLSMNPVVVRFTTGDEWHLQCDKGDLGRIEALAAELAGP